MGVQARVVIYAATVPEGESAAAAAFARLDELEQVMSDYRPDSELMRLCARAGQGPIPIRDDLFIAAKTGGAFDPTLGPLTTLWRDSRRARSLPDAAALADARARTGWRRIHLDTRGRTADVTRPGMRLDLGGIGKGYAAHEAVKTLRARGIDRCLVAIAGDIAVGDPPPGNQGWTIAVGGDNALAPLRNTCISTSGDAEQFVQIEGVRYSHILDPATGLGLTRSVRATVIHPDGATADALATALAVLGCSAGTPETIAAFPGAAACVVEMSPGGTVRTPFVTDHFPRAERP
jgi:thiamine biosynthesis lipoprotein